MPLHIFNMVGSILKGMFYFKRLICTEEKLNKGRQRYVGCAVLLYEQIKSYCNRIFSKYCDCRFSKQLDDFRDHQLVWKN